jgi:hypothetical protein
MATTLVYDFTKNPIEPIEIDEDELYASMRLAAHRFWISERRMPAAVIVSLQLAQALTGTVATHQLGELHFYGGVFLDEVTNVPLIARSAYLDPLFQFI